MNLMRKIGYGLCAAGMACALSLGYIVSHEYADIPSFPEFCKKGRKKNDVAAIITALVAEQLCAGNARIEWKVQRTLFPSGEIIIEKEVYPNNSSVRSVSSVLQRRYCDYEAHGHFRTDWYPRITLTTKEYSISGWKEMNLQSVLRNEIRGELDSGRSIQIVITSGVNVTINAHAGVIAGICSEEKMPDWQISGNHHGKDIHVDVNIPDSLGMTLEGRITKQ
ncbi:hypothetical protein HY485_04835 [Candidatus Woesearchaeota archaeon]|nr:hypothetical protein [Candidatus Woesearchaeota archaeon]